MRIGAIIVMAHLLEHALEAERQEAAMRQRFAGQPFVPCTLEDEARYKAGLSFRARDQAGNLHVIGSALKPGWQVLTPEQNPG